MSSQLSCMVDTIAMRVGLRKLMFPITTTRTSAATAARGYGVRETASLNHQITITILSSSSSIITTIMTLVILIIITPPARRH
jgi:hypothetical protein